MFEQSFAQLLRQFLGDFVEDGSILDEKVQLGVWSGNIVLDDLKLKSSILDAINFPVTLAFGSIGRLEFRIPWSSLNTDPIIVTIDRVLLLLEPKYVWNPDGQDIREQTVKQAKLAAAQLFASEQKNFDNPLQGYKDYAKKWLFESVINRIVENIQVTIRDVHIRYEDHISCPSAFAVGLTLDSLVANSRSNSPFTFDISQLETYSKRKTGKEKIFDEYINNASSIHKVVETTFLSAYWNPLQEHTLSLANMRYVGRSSNEIETLMLRAIPKHDYAYKERPHHAFVLFPMDFVALLDINIDLRNRKARTSTRFVVPRFSFCLEDRQLREFISLYSNMANFMQLEKVSSLRPSVSVVDDCRAWWQYAINAVIKQKAKKKTSLSWDKLKSRRNDRFVYIELWKWKLAQQNPKTATSNIPWSSKMSISEKRTYNYKGNKVYSSLLSAALHRESIKRALVDSGSDLYSYLSSESNAKYSPRDVVLLLDVLEFHLSFSDISFYRYLAELDLEDLMPSPQQSSWIGGIVSWASGKSNEEERKQLFDHFEDENHRSFDLISAEISHVIAINVILSRFTLGLSVDSTQISNLTNENDWNTITTSLPFLEIESLALSTGIFLYDEGVHTEIKASLQDLEVYEVSPISSPEASIGLPCKYQYNKILSRKYSGKKQWSAAKKTSPNRHTEKYVKLSDRLGFTGTLTDLNQVGLQTIEKLLTSQGALFTTMITLAPYNKQREISIILDLAETEALLSPSAVWINCLMTFLSWPEDVEYWSEMEMKTLNQLADIKARIEAKYEFMMRNHVNVAIDANINAPIVVICPSNEDDLECSDVLVVDLGLTKVKSEKLAKANYNDTSNSLEKSSVVRKLVLDQVEESVEIAVESVEVTERCDSSDESLYDVLSVSVAHVEVFMMPWKTWRQRRPDSQSKSQLVEKFDASMQIQLCVLPWDITLPQARFKIDLPNICLQLSESKCSRVISFSNRLIGNFNKFLQSQNENLSRFRAALHNSQRNSIGIKRTNSLGSKLNISNSDNISQLTQKNLDSLSISKIDSMDDISNDHDNISDTLSDDETYQMSEVEQSAREENEIIRNIDRIQQLIKQKEIQKAKISANIRVFEGDNTRKEHFAKLQLDWKTCNSDLQFLRVQFVEATMLLENFRLNSKIVFSSNTSIVSNNESFPKNVLDSMTSLSNISECYVKKRSELKTTFLKTRPALQGSIRGGVGGDKEFVTIALTISSIDFIYSCEGGIVNSDSTSAFPTTPVSDSATSEEVLREDDSSLNMNFDSSLCKVKLKLSNLSFSQRQRALGIDSCFQLQNITLSGKHLARERYSSDELGWDELITSVSHSHIQDSLWSPIRSPMKSAMLFRVDMKQMNLLRSDGVASRSFDVACYLGSLNLHIRPNLCSKVINSVNIVYDHIETDSIVSEPKQSTHDWLNCVLFCRPSDESPIDNIQMHLKCSEISVSLYDAQTSNSVESLDSFSSPSKESYSIQPDNVPLFRLSLWSISVAAQLGVNLCKLTYKAKDASLIHIPDGVALFKRKHINNKPLLKITLCAQKTRDSMNSGQSKTSISSALMMSPTGIVVSPELLADFIDILEQYFQIESKSTRSEESTINNEFVFDDNRLRDLLDQNVWDLQANFDEITVDIVSSERTANGTDNFSLEMLFQSLAANARGFENKLLAVSCDIHDFGITVDHAITVTQPFDLRFDCAFILPGANGSTESYPSDFLSHQRRSLCSSTLLQYVLKKSKFLDNSDNKLLHVQVALAASPITVLINEYVSNRIGKWTKAMDSILPRLLPLDSQQQSSHFSNGFRLSNCSFCIHFKFYGIIVNMNSVHSQSPASTDVDMSDRCICKISTSLEAQMDLCADNSTIQFAVDKLHAFSPLQESATTVLDASIDSTPQIVFGDRDISNLRKDNMPFLVIARFSDKTLTTSIDIGSITCQLSLKIISNLTDFWSSVFDNFNASVYRDYYRNESESIAPTNSLDLIVNQIQPIIITAKSFSLPFGADSVTISIHLHQSRVVVFLPDDHQESKNALIFSSEANLNLTCSSFGEMQKYSDGIFLQGNANFRNVSIEFVSNEFSLSEEDIVSISNSPDSINGDRHLLLKPISIAVQQQMHLDVISATDEFRVLSNQVNIQLEGLVVSIPIMLKEISLILTGFCDWNRFINEKMKRPCVLNKKQGSYSIESSLIPESLCDLLRYGSHRICRHQISVLIEGSRCILASGDKLDAIEPSIEVVIHSLSTNVSIHPILDIVHYRYVGDSESLRGKNVSGLSPHPTKKRSREPNTLNEPILNEDHSTEASVISALLMSKSFLVQDMKGSFNDSLVSSTIDVCLKVEIRYFDEVTLYLEPLKERTAGLESIVEPLSITSRIVKHSSVTSTKHNEHNLCVLVSDEHTAKNTNSQSNITSFIGSNNNNCITFDRKYIHHSCLTNLGFNNKEVLNSIGQELTQNDIFEGIFRIMDSQNTLNEVIDRVKVDFLENTFINVSDRALPRMIEVIIFLMNVFELVSCNNNPSSNVHSDFKYCKPMLITANIGNIICSLLDTEKRREVLVAYLDAINAVANIHDFICHLGVKIGNMHIDNSSDTSYIHPCIMTTLLCDASDAHSQQPFLVSDMQIDLRSAGSIPKLKLSFSDAIVCIEGNMLLQITEMITKTFSAFPKAYYVRSNPTLININHLELSEVFVNLTCNLCYEPQFIPSNSGLLLQLACRLILPLVASVCKFESFPFVISKYSASNGATASSALVALNRHIHWNLFKNIICMPLCFDCIGSPLSLLHLPRGRSVVDLRVWKELLSFPRNILFAFFNKLYHFLGCFQNLTITTSLLDLTHGYTPIRDERKLPKPDNVSAVAWKPKGKGSVMMYILHGTLRIVSKPVVATIQYTFSTIGSIRRFLFNRNSYFNANSIIGSKHLSRRRLPRLFSTLQPVIANMRNSELEGWRLTRGLWEGGLPAEVNNYHSHYLTNHGDIIIITSSNIVQVTKKVRFLPHALVNFIQNDKGDFELVMFESCTYDSDSAVPLVQRSRDFVVSHSFDLICSIENIVYAEIVGSARNTVTIGIENCKDINSNNAITQRELCFTSDFVAESFLREVQAIVEVDADVNP